MLSDNKQTIRAFMAAALLAAGEENPAAQLSRQLPAPAADLGM